MHFTILKNGDVINLQEVSYIHLSKTEECAYVYIKHLMHGSDEYTDIKGNIAKRLKISLEDYDRICAKIR